MLITGLILALTLAYSQSVSYESLVKEQWYQFKMEHHKIYPTEDEEQYRMTVFTDNIVTILKHNKLYEMGLSSYQMDMNQFGDLTHSEFKRFYTTSSRGPPKDEENVELPTQRLLSNLASRHSVSELPKNIDWRTKGAVTEVKNQSDCGSCYAFSALGSLESHYYLKTGKLVSLSEQNIVDCTKTREYKNSGCLGGRVDYTFKYIIDHGVCTAKSYPYMGKQSPKCRFNEGHIGATMRSYVNLPAGDEKELQSIVAIVGPVSVMVDGSHMQFYKDGIFDECSSDDINHGMVVIGYGSDKNKDYWILKNSWGYRWGKDGYILIKKNGKNVCGIVSEALYPLV